MKRTLCVLCAVLMLLLCACGEASVPDPSETPTPAAPSQTVQPSAPEPTAEVTAEPSPEPSPEPTAVNPLTGLPMQDEELTRSRPVAIMLNNIKAAMPQQGNSQADIIYEVLAEGGITRMLGIYQDISQLGVVGSVRSARLYYLELALGHDAVYVHAGGSPEFYEKKEAWGLETVDGVNGYYAYADTGLFWRDRERVDGNYYAYEHSLVTSGQRLTEVLTRRGVLGEHAEDYTYEMQFAEAAVPAGGEAVSAITVPFSGYKSTVFRYDAQSGLYSVEQYGQPYIDGNDGDQITVANVLVLRTQCTVVDDAGRLTVELTSGEGWFSCGGVLIPITWEKGEKEQQLRYYDQSGQPLTLSTGKSYVCIIPLSRRIETEPAV